MKKFLATLLALVMVLSLVACGGGGDDTKTPDSSTPSTGDTSTPSTGDTTTPDANPAADVKVGVILIGDENEGYSYAHIAGIRGAQQNLGLSDDQIIWYYTIPEDETAYDKCVDLADQGCDVIFTNSYGHQSFAQQAAAEYPDVTFVAMTGDTALASGLPNFKNAFTEIYEARYVSGVVAGMKVKELVEAGSLKDSNFDANGNVKLGYVGAFPFAEVVSGYTAFYLGAKSVYDKVVMDVRFTNSWFDVTGESEAAKALMAGGCVIIGQHADSTGSPTAVQAAYEAGDTVFCVGYNIDMLAAAPDAALTSPTNDWSVYYTYAIETIINGGEIMTNWAEGYDQGAVAITALGPQAAAGTAEAVAAAEAALSDGSLHVFETSKFTVGGQEVTSFLARDTDGDWVNDTDEAVFDGYLHESYFQAAPCFSLEIDGITKLN